MNDRNNIVTSYTCLTLQGTIISGPADHTHTFHSCHHSSSGPLKKTGDPNRLTQLYLYEIIYV